MSDPDLCARVARVMGLNWPAIITEDDGRRWCIADGDCFEPDTDPADAWRVVEWAASRYAYRTFHNPWTVELWAPWSGGVNPDCMGAEAEGEGETLMLALCNAVAALGGE